MRIAIIGAGAAGLAALRHCTTFDDISVICYEKTDKIGGTWVYVPEIGNDQYGLPIHSSMYQSLRTNLPKEVMGYPDYPIPENAKSYLSREEILQFLNSYCDHFQVRNRIAFSHNVELVEPIETNSKESIDNQEIRKVQNDTIPVRNVQHARNWKLRIKDLARNAIIEETFDAVMVCNGHYFEPNIPVLKGQDTFQGEQLHSHDYRVADLFSGKIVAVFGAGPSGMDLALEISYKAKRVILSHHLQEPILTKFPDNVIQKPDIVELTENKAIFKDHTDETIDAIFYCTGYKYSFPFLAKSCGVRVDSNMVTPLWKHLISIEHPTLAIVGLPYYVCAFSMFDLQVRFVLKFWRGEKHFPSKEDMHAEEALELQRKLNLGLSKRHYHMMGPEQGQYYQSLATTAGITPLPLVLTKLHNESSMRFLDDLVHYREDRYKILDDENFIQLNSMSNEQKTRK